jgi:hypothetical protein
MALAAKGRDDGCDMRFHEKKKGRRRDRQRRGYTVKYFQVQQKGAIWDFS